MEPELEQDPNYTPMMRRLRELVLQYERDPEHAITQEHISHRSVCVSRYGGRAIEAFLCTVYQEILAERFGAEQSTIVFPPYVSKSSVPPQSVTRALKLARKEPVKRQKPPTLRRAARLRVGRVF